MLAVDSSIIAKICGLEVGPEWRSLIISMRGRYSSQDR
jgi:hypothetical protein